MAISRTRLVATVVLAASVAGCSAAPSSVASPDGSPSGTRPSGASSPVGGTPPPATATPEASPTTPPPVGDAFAILGAPAQPFPVSITCSGAIGASDPVAIVKLHADPADVTELRDYANIAKPRNACTLKNVQVLQLIDPRHIVIAVPDPPTSERLYAVVDLPAVHYHWFSLPMGNFGNQLLAVSPHLDQVAWNEVENGVAYDRIHLTRATGDHLLANLPDTNSGRCGAPTDSNNAAFTRNQSALFVLDEPLPEISLIVAKGTKVVYSDLGTAAAKATTRPLYALWSPTDEVLYFAQSGNVWQWTQALGATILLPGVTWDSATISPDGSRLAYAVTNADGTHDVYLLALGSDGPAMKIGKGHRGGPVFLNNRQLFYLPDGGLSGCTGGASSRSLIYDVQTRTEAGSIIDGVERMWPATGTHN